MPLRNPFCDLNMYEYFFHSLRCSFGYLPEGSSDVQTADTLLLRSASDRINQQVNLLIDLCILCCNRLSNFIASTPSCQIVSDFMVH